MSVVQSWRSWWSGEKEQEEGENSQETSEEKKDEEEGQNQAIPPAWVKGFGGKSHHPSCTSYNAVLCCRSCSKCR